MSGDDHRIAADTYLGGVIEISKERDALRARVAELEDALREIDESATLLAKTDLLNGPEQEMARIAVRGLAAMARRVLKAALEKGKVMKLRKPLAITSQTLIEVLKERDALKARVKELERTLSTDAYEKRVAELEAELARFHRAAVYGMPLPHKGQEPQP